MKCRNIISFKTLNDDKNTVIELQKNCLYLKWSWMVKFLVGKHEEFLKFGRGLVGLTSQYKVQYSLW